jgi:hypothetical protein
MSNYPPGVTGGEEIFQAPPDIEWVPVDPEDAAAEIGMGLHTGLRKGTDAEDAHKLWVAINQSETSAWIDACSYLVSGLKYMGMALCRKEQI